jgi:hypothetical protein
VRIADRAVRAHEIQHVPAVMLSSSIEAFNPHARAICGFPASVNKQTRSLERPTKTFTGKCYTYFVSPSIAETTRFSANPRQCTSGLITCLEETMGVVR